MTKLVEISCTVVTLLAVVTVYGGLLPGGVVQTLAKVCPFGSLNVTCTTSPEAGLYGCPFDVPVRVLRVIEAIPLAPAPFVSVQLQSLPISMLRWATWFEPGAYVEFAGGGSCVALMSARRHSCGSAVCGAVHGMGPMKADAKRGTVMLDAK